MCTSYELALSLKARRLVHCATDGRMLRSKMSGSKWFSVQPQIKDLEIRKTWQKGYHSHVSGVAVEMSKLTKRVWRRLRDFLDKFLKHQYAPFQFPERCVSCKKSKEVHVGVFGRSFLHLAATAVSVRRDYYSSYTWRVSQHS